MKKFSHERFNELLTEVTADIRKLSDLKGGEYAGDTDRLANFRRNAEAMGVPMETIWGVYAAKHWDAIMQYVQDKNTGKTRERMEPIKGRASDLIVYLCLFMAMCEESDGEPATDWIPFNGQAIQGNPLVDCKNSDGTIFRNFHAYDVYWENVASYRIVSDA